MDPIAMQKQLRDNSEDLTRYIGDLNNWQSEIKQKEQNLKSGGQDNKKSIPPVRSKKNKGKASKIEVTPSTSTAAAPSAAEKAPTPNGQDSSTEAEFINYDFEKATEAYNKERQGKSLSATIKESEDKQKRLDEANYEKENGNMNVKNKKWKEAIECYTKAIGHDNTNPIFFANRALCYIKLERYFEAVEDCSKAASLDSSYVKAYLRRGLAYTSLEEPEAAIEDLTKAVELEPANKEARKCLTDAKALQKKLGSNDNSTIIAISKSINERSKAPLKRISVTEVGCSAKQIVKQVELSESTQRPSSLELKKPISSAPSSRASTPKSSTPRTPITPLSLSTPVYLSDIPEAPKNSTQLILTWNQIKPESRYKYLSQIPGSQLPQVFGDALESNIFSDVLIALKSANNEDPVAEYLLGLSETKRFNTLALFMTNEDKSIVKDLLSRSSAENHITEKEAEHLRKRFCV